MVREREAACWMEKREVSMQKEEFIPGGWKSQREGSIVQCGPDPVEHSMEGKERFLEDGRVRGKPTTHNVIMALLKAP